MRLTEDELIRELREERPEIDPEFGDELDRWAAAGFPRARPGGASAATGRWSRLRERFAATPPRRVLAPIGAAATLIVIVGVVVSQSGRLSPGDGADSGSAASVSAPTGRSDAAAGTAAPPAAESGAAGSSVGQAQAARSSSDPQLDDLGETKASDVPPAKRKYARDVNLSLATSPTDFNDTADGVLDVVDQQRGFVRSSNVSSGDPGVPGAELGRATFDLRIPASRLEQAVAALSDLGHVVSRTDGVKDITGRFVSTKKRIAELQQTRSNLLAQLEDAFTTSEQESLKRRIAIVESQLQAAEGELGDAQRRVQLVPVSVTIAADRAVAGAGDEPGWSIGDALDDAGSALQTVAGILIVSAAVLGPLALIPLVAWLAARELGRRRREAALDRG